MPGFAAARVVVLYGPANLAAEVQDLMKGGFIELLDLPLNVGPLPGFVVAAQVEERAHQSDRPWRRMLHSDLSEWLIHRCRGTEAEIFLVIDVVVPCAPRPPRLEVDDGHKRHYVDPEGCVQEVALLGRELPEITHDDDRQGHPEGHKNHDLDAPKLEVGAKHNHGVQEPELVFHRVEVVNGNAGGTPVRAHQVGPQGQYERVSGANVHAEAPLEPCKDDQVAGPHGAYEDKDRHVYEQQLLKRLHDVQADLLPQIWLQHLGNHLPKAVQGPSLVHVRQGKVGLVAVHQQTLLVVEGPVEALQGRHKLARHAGPHDAHVLRCEERVHHGQEQHLDGDISGQREHGRAGRKHVAPYHLQGAVREDLDHDAQEREYKNH
mmetsp:Transcript_86806/g.271686  ORF Transcript_86806/g.271686 Transcript_86806/m.271686 type:complete len:377 (-) Transcript_86806:605-1735(-)